TGPLIFGHRVAEIMNGAKASVGSCTLRVVFRSPAPGAPLPDVEDLLICGINDLIFIGFVGESDGFLSNGEPGRLQTTQKGLIGTYFKGNPRRRVGLDAFPAEHIIVTPLAAE